MNYLDFDKFDCYLYYFFIYLVFDLRLVVCQFFFFDILCSCFFSFIVQIDSKIYNNIELYVFEIKLFDLILN